MNRCIQTEHEVIAIDDSRVLPILVQGSEQVLILKIQLVILVQATAMPMPYLYSIHNICQALQIILLSDCTSTVWIYFMICATADGKATCVIKHFGLIIVNN